VLEDNVRWVQETTLDGTRYLLHFTFNQREDAWYVSLHDVNDVPLASGAKIVANWFLFLRKIDPATMPPGLMFVSDSSGGGTDPGVNELGERVKLIYIEEVDVAEIEAEGA
jgi:hypothetical protein